MFDHTPGEHPHWLGDVVGISTVSFSFELQVNGVDLSSAVMRFLMSAAIHFPPVFFFWGEVNDRSVADVGEL